jgi:hypothetical protein
LKAGNPPNDGKNLPNNGKGWKHTAEVARKDIPPKKAINWRPVRRQRRRR